MKFLIRRWSVAFLTGALLLFAVSCGAFSGKEGPSSATPTSTYEEPSGFIFDRSAYVSDEAFENCKPLADNLTSRNMIGVLRHTVVYRDNLNNIARVWQDQRFGVSFRVGEYVLTARHVAGEDPGYQIPEDPRFRAEHRYDFYPVGELFTSRPTFSDFSSGDIFRSGEFLPLRFLYSTGMSSDFVAFEIENPQTVSQDPFSHQYARGLVDFAPICFFRLFFDFEKQSAEFLVIDGKSLSDERSARELVPYPGSLRYVVRVFAFYGGWTFGPGSSGSPVFLKTGNSYALIGLAYARGNGNIAISHDIESIREKLIQETRIDIFK